MQSTQHKTFHVPEERRDFPHGHADILHFTGGEVGRLVFDPGGRWLRDVTSLPSGHDAWVVGDEAVAVIDWFGASHYATQ